MLWIRILLLMFSLQSALIMAKMQDFTLDINDILSDNLMPMSLMTLEKDGKSNFSNLSSIFDIGHNAELLNNSIGSFDKAFNSMGFHRKMINNFLCSKFVAEQILDDLSPTMKKNRLGVASLAMDSPDTLGNLTRFKGLSANEKRKMLFDEGSNEYKNWLSKTTTLNDIYRTMGVNNNQKEEATDNIHRQDHFLEDEESDYKDLFEEGEVTGFMAHKPIPDSSTTHSQFTPLPQQTAGAKQGTFRKFADDDDVDNISPLLSSSAPHSFPKLHEIQTLSNGYNYPTGFPSGGYSFNHQQTYGPPAPAPVHPPAMSSKKSISIKDLFDIALTTLAFLSFGMFIVQVIMCISMAKSSSTTEMMMPMLEVLPIDEAETAEVRSKRSIKAEKKKLKEDHQFNATMSKVDEISRGALRAIDAFIHVRNDKGECLKRMICENNKVSRAVINIQRFTIPLFGISLSYVSNQFNDFPMISNLGGLHASLIGLGNGDCRIFKCDTKNLVKLKKDRR